MLSNPEKMSTTIEFWFIFFSHDLIIQIITGVWKYIFLMMNFVRHLITLQCGKKCRRVLIQLCKLQRNTIHEINEANWADPVAEFIEGQHLEFIKIHTASRVCKRKNCKISWKVSDLSCRYETLNWFFIKSIFRRSRSCWINFSIHLLKLWNLHFTFIFSICFISTQLEAYTHNMSWHFQLFSHISPIINVKQRYGGVEVVKELVRREHNSSKIRPKSHSNENETSWCRNRSLNCLFCFSFISLELETWKYISCTMIDEHAIFNNKAKELMKITKKSLFFYRNAYLEFIRQTTLAFS